MPESSPPHGIFDAVNSPTLVWTQGLLVLLGLFILACLTALTYRLVLRKKRISSRAARPNPWSDLRRALSREGQNSTSEPEHLSVLARVLRQGLELQSQKPYTAWTTAEIAEALTHNSTFSSDFQMQCVEVLRAADRAQFAHPGAGDSEIDQGTGAHYEKLISGWLDSLQHGRPL